MPLEPVVLLVPSTAAAQEWPRRVASTGVALAGVYAFTLPQLARVLAEPGLLGSGLDAWDSGHASLLAARLLDGPHGLPLSADLPRAPLAHRLSRTLAELRLAGIAPERLQALAEAPAPAEDAVRRRGIAALYGAYVEHIEGRFADTATQLGAARERLRAAPFLQGLRVLVVGDPELAPLERELLAALADLIPVQRLAEGAPPGLHGGSFAQWAEEQSIATVPLARTVLAPAAPATPPTGLQRLRSGLFESPAGAPVRDGAVELVTAAGEGAEARAIARRLLRAASDGIPFEQMGVALPRPDTYTALLVDLFDHAGIPWRLHPSLPLRYGRCARSLLLLLRCRDLARADVMEFLTFAPVPFEELLGDGRSADPVGWDALTRQARIVSGLDRWMVGLRSFAEAERDEGARAGAERRAHHERQAASAEALLRIVELLSTTLLSLSGEASWLEWSGQLLTVLGQWIGPDFDREALVSVVEDLASLGSLGGRASFAEVEAVLESRLEWERQPLRPRAGGAVHVGSLDALAGLPFRVLAIPGLVEGGFPGPLRPDPFLPDDDRQALATPRRRQLSLFDEGQDERPLPTAQDRLLEQRRAFARAVAQAGERLVLSWPRADPRSGRERLPSLFLVAAASALEGRPVGAEDLGALVTEEGPDLPVAATLDASERDRARIRAGGRREAAAIAAASPFFRRSVEAARWRWRSGRLSAWDGLVRDLPPDLARRLDPTALTVSASRLATYASCGFRYLLRHVLRLEPLPEPVERQRLDPLEKGNLFHQVAERFLRERRQRGELPVRDSTQVRSRLRELGEQALAELVEGSPPRLTLLWERECESFHELLQTWLSREIAMGASGTPAHFEVAFGLPAGSPDEPYQSEPIDVDLGGGRRLRIAGRIDRVDRLADGSLRLRDYKTGRAPLRKDPFLFKGGRHLQMPFYVLAAASLFPENPVAEAWLDYVDAGRRVEFDPAAVTGERFTALLRDLCDAIGSGLFLQEPESCSFCEFQPACGPSGALAARRARQRRDRDVIRYALLREVP